MARGWLSLVLLLRFGLLFRIGVFWCSALIPDGDGSANSGTAESSPWATRRLHSDGPGQRYLNGPPRAFRLLVLACTLAFKITRVLVTLQVSD